MRLLKVCSVLFFVCIPTISSLILNKNGTLRSVEVTQNELTRRKGISRSTSSSSGEKSRVKNNDKKSSKSSLEQSISWTSDSSSNEFKKDPTKKGKKKNKKHVPVSSADRIGWRKWHRKCTKCPEMLKKFKKPDISWICGAYQRARRSFKSECLMYYRNCQDGTMFVKIHDHPCDDDKIKGELPHGNHFFYDYKVTLSDESGATSSSLESSSDSSDFWDASVYV